MKLRKKYAVWLLFLCVLLICSLAPSVYAESDVEKELNETIDEQLGGIDWSGLEDYFDGLGEDDNKLFDGSFLKKIKKILGGEMDTTAASYLGFLGDVFLGEFNKVLPSLLSVAAICILSGLINRTKTTLLSDSTGELINFVCYGVIILLVLSGVWELLDSTKVTVLRIKQLTNVAMPILLAMMSATGAAVGTKVYQPSVALLSSGITEIIANIILPMFIFTVVFSVISNLSKNIRLDKLSDFFKKTSVWIVGISFTVFTGFLTVQGLTSSTIDGDQKLHSDTRRLSCGRLRPDSCKQRTDKKLFGSGGSDFTGNHHYGARFENHCFQSGVEFCYGNSGTDCGRQDSGFFERSRQKSDYIACFHTCGGFYAVYIDYADYFFGKYFCLRGGV